MNDYEQLIKERDALLNENKLLKKGIDKAAEDLSNDDEYCVDPNSRSGIYNQKVGGYISTWKCLNNLQCVACIKQYLLTDKFSLLQE